MSNYEVKNISLKEFVSAFAGEGNDANFRVFSDRKDKSFKGAKLSCSLDKVNELVPELIKHNRNYRGIFFVVNGGGHSDKEINKINAQFFECDNLSIEKQLEAINEFPLEPSIIVKTKKSLHTYFLIKDGKVEDYRRIQKKLAKHFNGDMSCINESRVMRVPSFYHCKEEPVLVQCIKFDPHIVYTQEDVEHHLKYTSKEEDKVKVNSINRKGLENICCNCDFIKHCKDNALNLPEPQWFAMISNLANLEGGAERIHEYSKSYPNYSVEETNQKIDRYIQSGVGPITCSTIKDYGFNCPKYETQCKCKSPVGLYDTPLDGATLTTLVNVLVRSSDNTENGLMAMNFIEKYLYNVDSVLAEIIIEETLKQHLNLKNVRALKNHYKKLNKEYLNLKKSGNFSELPCWYEVYDKGIRFLSGVLADYLSKEIDAIYVAESFYIYKDGVYEEFSDDQVSRLIRGYLVSRYTTMGGINDVREQWKVIILKSSQDINKSPYMLNIKNGLLDIKNNELLPHTPTYLSNIQLNVSYIENSTCPVFLQFLNRVLSKELVFLIQEIIGYLLIPVTQAQKCFLFNGLPRTGKSTLLWIIEHLLLGERNVSNIALQDLDERFKTAELYSKLGNIFSDLPSKPIEDTGMFKILTGEDYVMAERKNKNPFKFKPYARLVFSSNELPRNYGDRSDAFYRRLIIIPFVKPIAEEDIDVNLKDKLSEEVNGIFLWALEGLNRLIKNDFKFTETKETEEAKKKYKYENNNVLLFVDECCSIHSEASCSRKELYDNYKVYCEEVGLRSMSQIKFNTELELNFNDIKRGRDTISKLRVWKGIKMMTI